MPRLAILAFYFFPENAGGRRPYQLRRHLPDLGWDVRVVCAKLPGDEQRGDPALHETARGKLGEWLRRILPADDRPLFEQWSGAASQGQDRAQDPIKAKALRQLRSLALLPDEFVPWIAMAVAAAVQDPAVRDADVILATSPPYSVQVAGWLVARLLNKPLVVDFRDPHALNAITPPGRLDRPLREAMERRIMRDAAAITTVSEGFARRQSALAELPVHAIRNSWEPEDGAPVMPPGPDDPFVLAHTGTIYPSEQDVPTFAAGLALAASRGVPVTLRHCGVGARFVVDRLAPEDRHLVDDQGRLPRAEAVAMRASASAQLMFLPSGDHVEGWIPSKVFDYLASARPILAVGDEHNEPAEILAAAGAGAVCPTPEAVADRIEALWLAQREGRLEEQVVPAEVARRHSGRAMAEAFDRVLREALVG